MSEPITTKRYSLRASSPLPQQEGVGCSIGTPPSKYILQSFGVDVTETDNYDAIVSLFASEVMQGLQNYEDTDEFREHSFTRISYNGTNYQDTDGNMVFKGTEDHSSKWINEEDGLSWVK